MKKVTHGQIERARNLLPNQTFPVPKPRAGHLSKPEDAYYCRACLAMFEAECVCDRV